MPDMEAEAKSPARYRHLGGLVAGMTIAFAAPVPGAAFAQQVKLGSVGTKGDAGPVAATAPINGEPVSPKPATGFGLTGDWGGLRTNLKDRGVDIDISFLGELAGNIRGGERHAVTQVMGYVLGTTIDMDKFAGVEGGKIQLALSKRSGYNLMDKAGISMLLQPQALYGRGQTYRLSELWYQQRFGTIASIKLGRVNMGEDFATLPCDASSLALCGAQIGNLVGDYWFNSPVSQWGTVMRLTADDLSIMTGVYEYNPNNLDNGIALSHGGAKSVTVPVELGLRSHLGASRLPGLYRVGAWYSGARADDVLTGVDGRPFATSGLDPIRREGRYGGYLLMQQQLTGRFVDDGNGPRTTHGLTAYLNFTQTDRRTTRLENQVGLWLSYIGILANRPDDDFGLNMARTHVNRRASYSDLLASPDTPRAGSEYAMELYYGVHIRNWLILRPSVQYIVNPVGISSERDLVMPGLISSITF
ncbi:porin, OprB family [Sphingobium sp. AP50]|uniref:carbohydrate porin n=1 Tax=Sphingobium sp. AP50 TaxID=1884369 RepID=UPI0008B46920|nr:carbohydrate porin [Sphingobium sp. AP50]SEK00893.1 porin, OprB family [Sphingobium sp. AP50]